MKNFLIFLLIMTAGCSDTSVQEIAPSEIKQNDFVLDVRTAIEHKKISLAQKHWLVPLDKLNAEKFIHEHDLDGSKPLYLLCRSGRRATEAAKKFKKAGFKNVIIIRGGIIAAEKAGLPLKKAD